MLRIFRGEYTTSYMISIITNTFTDSVEPNITTVLTS